MTAPIWIGRPRGTSVKFANKINKPADAPKPRVIPRWAAKGLAPVDIKNGKRTFSIRRGKHACNRGSVVIRSPHIKVGL